MKRILVAAVMCAGLITANAQSKIEFEEYKLKNGMNVIYMKTIQHQL